ncbi:hypothetical protein IGI39_001574 [Enterococcus sp. AZ135]
MISFLYCLHLIKNFEAKVTIFSYELYQKFVIIKMIITLKGE